MAAKEVALGSTSLVQIRADSTSWRPSMWSGEEMLLSSPLGQAAEPCPQPQGRSSLPPSWIRESSPVLEMLCLG